MRRRSKKVVFVPGYGDYSDLVWPNWLGQELKKAGFDFLFLTMPNPMYPEVFDWLAFLKSQKIKIDQDTYFVGHSLGCITIIRHLETLPARTVAGGCVFVSGFYSLPRIPLLSEFCRLPLDYDKAKKQAKDFVMIVSDNDHLIPMVGSEDLAKKIGARVIVIPGQGHFKSDVKEIPSLLNSILEMDQMKDELREIKKLKKNVTSNL